MRLVCPNCSTQYEVDDSAVPATGREVQCGHCSSTWFQAPARSNVPQNGDKGELPKWVEEIVEDDCEKATAESQKSADAAAAAKAVAQSVAAAAIAAKLTGSDKKREVETAQTEPSQAPVEPVQAPPQPMQ